MTTLTKKKNSIEIGKPETDYEGVRDCLIAIDTLLKTSQVHPRVGCKLTQKNNFLVLENIWFNGDAKAQGVLRQERGALVNLAWVMRTFEQVAIAHDLIPIIVDAGFTRELINKACKLNREKFDSPLDYVCVRHPDSSAQLEFLSDRSNPVFYAPKEIIFEWLSINHSPNPQRKVLLLNKPMQEQKH